MRWATALLLSAFAAPAAACPDFATPITSLSFESRYEEADDSRSAIDPETEGAAKAALEPLDAFVTDLSARADAALSAGDRAEAACIVTALERWAQADALADIGSETAALTLGSRLSGLALVAAQVLPAGSQAQRLEVSAWLRRRMADQMTFWETAPRGAAGGNLRAWAGLAGAGTALVTGDPVVRGWAAWSVTYIACTAAADGSLPQEMGRGRLALHYQFHAVVPLTVAAALLNQQGVPVRDGCDQALDRIVGFALRDVRAGGTASAAQAGEDQTLNRGIAGLADFQLSWAEAWLSLVADPDLEAEIAARRPLRYSKIGGDQTRIWRRN